MPPGRRGTYDSLDARCSACVMNGGVEDPCQPRGILAEIESRTGRPCPRVELDEENSEVAPVLTFVLSETLRSLAPVALRAATRGRSRGQRADILRRISVAVNDREVTSILYPEVKRG